MVDPQISVILINQKIAEQFLRVQINNHTEIIPTILEIPSKDRPFDLKKDPVVMKAVQMLYGNDQALDD